MRSLCLIFLVPFLANATDHCVSPAGSGTASGNDWNNTLAASALAGSSLVRGDAYYLKAGNYGGRNFQQANSGATTITVRAATVASHGPATGWSDANAGLVIFTADCNVYTDYWIFDGQTRAGYTNGYNLQFTNGTDGNGYNIAIESAAQTKEFTNIVFNCVEFEGTHGAFALSDMGIQVYPKCWGLYVTNCYFHDHGGNPVLANYGGGAGRPYIFERIYVARNHQSYNADHSEAFSMTGSGLLVRLSYFQDIISSGTITDASALSPPLADWEIEGNVFFWSTAYQHDSRAFHTDGIVGQFGQTFSGYYRIYNNTIWGITNYASTASIYNGGIETPGGSSVNYVIENNVWQECDSVNGFTSTANTVDYNTYLKVRSIGATDSSTHKVTGNTGILNAPLTMDFTLTGSAAGVVLSSPYDNADIVGNARGGDSVWDRGAFEFGSGPAQTGPVVIFGVIVGGNLKTQ